MPHGFWWRDREVKLPERGMMAREVMDEVRGLLDRPWSDTRSLLDASGGVLVSGWDTLRLGAFYVMGLNPGGSEDEVLTLRKSLEDGRMGGNEMGGNEWTAKAYKGSATKPVWTNFQKNVQTVFDKLQVAPNKTFSTNALFVRSPRQAGLVGAWDLWWDHCWPVHQVFLRVVRPRVVVCLGYGGGLSAWELLRHPRRRSGQHYVTHWKLESKEGGVAQGPWREEVCLDLGGETHRCAVLGLPHPSAWGKWPLSDKACGLIEEARRMAEAGS